MENFPIALLALALIFGYFLPSMIAAIRNHRNVGPILVINVLLGWTFLGWIVALVWSILAAPTAEART